MAIISIRKGQLSDLQTLTQFQSDMAFESEGLKLDRKILNNGVNKVLQDPTRGTYWIAEIQNQSAGCLLVVPEWSDWRDGWVWWIHSVYVSQQHRRQGVYKALYENLKSMVLKDPHLFGLRLYVEKDNLNAQNTYQSLGMDGQHYQMYQWMKQ